MITELEFVCFFSKVTEQLPARFLCNFVEGCSIEPRNNPFNFGVDPDPTHEQTIITNPTHVVLADYAYQRRLGY